MQTFVLWSDRVCPSTSSTTECPDAHDVSVDQKLKETSSKFRSTVRSTQTGFFGPVFCALICFLLLMANSCNAAPLNEQPSKGLQNSIIYSSLIRSANSPDLVLVRARRSPSDDIEGERVIKSEKKLYPKICYFSPIQCLFSSPTNLTKRRR